MMSKYSDTSSLAVILEIPGLEKTLRIRWLFSHPTLEFSIALSRTLPRSHLLSLSLSFFIVSLKCPLTESTLPYSWKPNNLSHKSKMPKENDYDHAYLFSEYFRFLYLFPLWQGCLLSFNIWLLLFLYMILMQYFRYCLTASLDSSQGSGCNE